MGNYTIAVLVGWAIAVWALCSVLFSDPGRFSSIGKSKWRWFLIELTAFIPYVGFIAALIYLFKVRVHFPPQPKLASPPRPAPSDYPAGNTGRNPFNPPATPARAPVQRTPCGCSGGKDTCSSCRGRGWHIGNSGQYDQACVTCGTSGRVTCGRCRGSGWLP
jgi:hypothetical protein